MSFDDVFADRQLPALYRAFGVDALVRRGADAPVAVRVIVDRDQQRLGQYSSVIGLVDTASFMRTQWIPERDDVLEWTDRLGQHSKSVESRLGDDGLEAVAVLHG